MGFEQEAIPFICECADDQCLARVELGLGQWQAVADRPDQFLIVAGHPRMQGEHVIDTLGPFGDRVQGKRLEGKDHGKGR